MEFPSLFNRFGDESLATAQRAIGLGVICVADGSSDDLWVMVRGRCHSGCGGVREPLVFQHPDRGVGSLIVRLPAGNAGRFPNRAVESLSRGPSSDTRPVVVLSVSFYIVCRTGCTGSRRSGRARRGLDCCIQCALFGAATRRTQCGGGAFAGSWGTGINQSKYGRPT